MKQLQQHGIKEMDTAALLTVITRSESIARHLSGPEKEALSFLGVFRNQWAHLRLPESGKFINLLGQCLAAFQALNISSEEVMTSMTKRFPSLDISSLTAPRPAFPDIEPVVRQRL